MMRQDFPYYRLVYFFAIHIFPFNFIIVIIIITWFLGFFSSLFSLNLCSMEYL